MPELPEVETVRLTLAPAIGYTVDRVWGSGKPLHMNRPVNLRGLRRASVGKAIDDIRRWGKYLLIDMSGHESSLLVHLGMTGRLRLVKPAAPRAAHTHVCFFLRKGRSRRELRYSDARRFGQVDFAARGAERDHPALARLGIDPLTDILDGPTLHALSRSTRQVVKTMLVDQRLIAGIGNIYASEALWQARIKPTLRSDRLSRPRAISLAAAVRDVLDRALGHGGTSLRDFVNADGKTGDHSHYLWVYDRAGESCPRPACDGVIRRTVIQGRATFHCPRCQDR